MKYNKFLLLTSGFLLPICITGLIVLNSCSGWFLKPLAEDDDVTSIQSVLKKPDLKVLDIGNSYSNGALDLLPTVVKACGADVKDMCLYKMVRSGASFKDWCNVCADKDPNTYSFRRVTGGLSVPVKAGSGQAEDGIRAMIKEFKSRMKR